LLSIHENCSRGFGVIAALFFWVALDIIFGDALGVIALRVFDGIVYLLGADDESSYKLLKAFLSYSLFIVIVNCAAFNRQLIGYFFKMLLT